MTTPSEDARYVRAELETIVSALRVPDLARLLQLARELLDEDAQASRLARSPR